ncbi:hypothetical protein H0H81_002164 [Sphagnurus paluster]|uniref:DUF7223 domain-containing protein n=1 Tax=Sphagnurus paluster TaxID=117069 RepID=A0A9P7FVV3_9AGAR|nr:hypothetical protein H0H81_002164 [Sphagnurus paluster]
MAYMAPKFSALLSMILILPITVNAGLNDWSKPCFQGECFYDLPASNGQASGSMKIWGSPDAISDITKAAGWTILGCSPDALAQDIRIVCNSDEDGESGCDHLYQSIGPVGKLVRLPENCGKSAFARISRAWIPEDQSIPANVASRLVRRDGSSPQVQALALDTNFGAIDAAATGEVNIAIQGSNVPGAEGDSVIIPARRRRGVVHDKRGLFTFIEEVFKKFNNFDRTVTKSLDPIDVNNDIPFFSQSISCSGFDASVNAGMKTKAHAVVSLGVAAAGTIVPPQLTEFGVFTGLNANFDGTMSLKANAKGKADSGQITLFQTGIPGLDFPGILTVGPTFKIMGQATASMDVNVDMTVDLSYTVTDAKLFFPPGSNQQNGGTFSAGNSPLKLAVSPSVKSNAAVSAHLTPRVELGVNALGGVAAANIFLNLDAAASVTMNLNAAANANVGVESTTGEVTTGASASVDGCVKGAAALKVNAGADGNFFNIFNPSTKAELFSKDFEIFSQCFNAKTRREAVPTLLSPPRSRISRNTSSGRQPQLMYRQLDFLCPANIESANALVAVA